jgi:MraZ protein
MLTGEFKTSLDDKGRISFPAKFREELGVDKLVVTKGIDSCLWVFTLVDWAEVQRKVRESTSPFQADGRMIRRELIGPAQEVDIDKIGRIAIPATLRDHASLSGETMVVGLDSYFEIWNAEIFTNNAAENKGELAKAAEKLSLFF